jgi:hypothetical protein
MTSETKLYVLVGGPLDGVRWPIEGEPPLTLELEAPPEVPHSDLQPGRIYAGLEEHHLKPRVGKYYLYGHVDGYTDAVCYLHEIIHSAFDVLLAGYRKPPEPTFAQLCAQQEHPDTSGETILAGRKHALKARPDFTLADGAHLFYARALREAFIAGAAWAQANKGEKP